MSISEESKEKKMDCQTVGGGGTVVASALLTSTGEVVRMFEFPTTMPPSDIVAATTAGLTTLEPDQAEYLEESIERSRKFWERGIDAGISFSPSDFKFSFHLKMPSAKEVKTTKRVIWRKQEK